MAVSLLMKPTLNLAQPSRPRSNTVVILGDSMAGNGGNDPVANPGNAGKLYSRGYWVWALVFLGNRLRLLANLGIGGETSVQILARVGAVVALAPAWCFGNAGTNDVTSGTSLTTIKANITAIWNALDAAGIRIVWSTLPPRGSYAGSQQADAENLNAWIKYQGRIRPNLIVVDAAAGLVNPGGGTNGVYAQGMNFDTVHPSSKGTGNWGRAVANAVAPFLPANPDPLLSSAQGDAANLLVKGRFTAVTGANSVTTGGYGMTLTGSPALTFSKIARTDGIPGSKQRIVMDPGNGVRYIMTDNVNIGSTLAINDVVSARIEYWASGIDTGASTGNRYIKLNIASYNGSVLTDMTTCLVPQDVFPTFDHSGVLWTPPIAVPSGTTLIQAQVDVAGGCTLDLDRFTVLNHTVLGLPTSVAA